MAHHEDQAVNLENFAGTNKAINSPRSLEACLRQGVDPAQLVPREFVVKKGELEDVARFEHGHYDKRRLGTLRHCSAVVFVQLPRHLLRSLRSLRVLPFLANASLPPPLSLFLLSWKVLLLLNPTHPRSSAVSHRRPFVHNPPLTTASTRSPFSLFHHPLLTVLFAPPRFAPHRLRSAPHSARPAGFTHSTRFTRFACPDML